MSVCLSVCVRARMCGVVCIVRVMCGVFMGSAGYQQVTLIYV